MVYIILFVCNFLLIPIMFPGKKNGFDANLGKKNSKYIYIHSYIIHIECEKGALKWNKTTYIIYIHNIRIMHETVEYTCTYK